MPIEMELGEGQEKERRRPLCAPNSSDHPQDKRENWLYYFYTWGNSVKSRPLPYRFHCFLKCKIFSGHLKATGIFSPLHWFLPTWNWLSQFSLSHRGGTPSDFCLQMIKPFPMSAPDLSSESRSGGWLKARVTTGTRGWSQRAIRLLPRAWWFLKLIVFQNCSGRELGRQLW